MLRWDRLEPRRFERAVQGLLRSQNPGMISIDGSGGDGGADSMLRTSDGRTVFEMKSYARLHANKRRKVEASLTKAKTSVPDMTHWVLIAPCNPTRVELAWFEGHLQKVAPNVRIEWRGIDWLDIQAANNPAFARYIQGSDNELLQAASEFSLEKSVLSGGAPDLIDRTMALRKRVDEISMHWTSDWAIEGSIVTNRIRPKHPDAHIVDPIRLTPRFSFDFSSDRSREVQKRLELTMDYGGSVKLDDQYFKGFSVDASPEARLLISGLERPGSLQISSEIATLDRPVRATVQMRGLTHMASLDVWFRTRTRGLRGVHFHGSDAAGATRIDLQVPFPDKQVGSAGSTFNVTFLDAWEFTPRDLVDVLRLHSAMREGGEVSVTIPGFVVARTTIEPRTGDLDYSVLARIAEVVVKMEELLGLTLQLPDGVSLQEVEVAEAAVAALQGEQADSGFESLTAHVVPGAVNEFIAQLPDGNFAAHTVQHDYKVTLGDLEIPYGPIALWMPEVELANRDELIRNPDVKDPVAVFKRVDQPIYIRSRADTMPFIDGDAAK